MDRLKRLIGRLKRSSKDEDFEKATREQAEKELREKLQEKAYKEPEYGYVWNVKDEDSKEAIASVFSDIDELVEEIASIALENAMELGLDLSNKRVCKEITREFIENVDKFITTLAEDNACFMGYKWSITRICAMRAKIKNSEVTERKFGKKPNGEEYTAEEIKALVGKAYVASRKKEFDGRRNKEATFTSIIVDMDDITKSVVRFIKPNDTEQDVLEYYSTKIMEICKEAQKNGIKKIIVPYSADGHSVTLIIDVDGFLGGKEGSITCFDSSLHFTEEVEDTEKVK